MDAAPFDLAAIAAQTPIASLEYQPEVGSTNDWALSLAADEDRLWPLLVLAAQQTGGRGRGVNRWWSASGALTFSLVVDAAERGLPLERWPSLALLSGLAVCETLHQLYPPGMFGLKWPNDVYLGGRKLCGILVEAPSHRGRIVVGVGINVNNSFAGAPTELRERATSLCDAAGGPFDLSEVLIAVVERMIERMQSADLLAEDFGRYCLLTGRLVQIESGQERIVGRCLGIDAHGALLVQTESGQRRVHAGTVVAWS